VQQPIFARCQGDEGTEAGGFHHGAQVAFANFWDLWVRNSVDRIACFFSSFTFSRTDQDGTVVFDTDICAGVFLDLVDHLAFRPNDLTDLVDRNLHRQDTWGGVAHGVCFIEHRSQHGQDMPSWFTSLGPRCCPDISWQAIEFGVKLDSCDEVPGSRNLEVHVTHGVFSTEDIGQRCITSFVIDGVGYKTHRDAGYRSTQGYSGVVQRQGRSADGAH